MAPTTMKKAMKTYKKAASDKVSKTKPGRPPMAPGKVMKMKATAGKVMKKNAPKSKTMKTKASAQTTKAMKVLKMKAVCSASPGKFASALLDILDGTIESPLDGAIDNSSETQILPASDPTAPTLPTTITTLPDITTSPEDKGAIRKRPAAAVAEVGEQSSPKKSKAALAEEEKVKIDEQVLASSRRKELRIMSAAMIKDMVRRKGLDCGKKASKADMIESIIGMEAKSRESVRQLRINARDVVVQKREEFSGKKNHELKELLRCYALQTGGTKPERVERLLALWKEQGEIEKVLAVMAFKARKAELHAMDKFDLYEMCRRKGVDALSKDILVDRLLVHESIDIWQEVMESRRQMD